MACSAAPGPPGVLLVTIDTWRADHIEHAPNVLALDGIRYTNAWTPIGLTTPAHASLLTGRLPPQHGLRANNHHGYALDASEVTLAERFQEAGYATAAFVSAWPAGPEGGMDQGFDRFSGPDSGERPTAETVAQATAWLDAQTGPWMLWVHAYDPHGPYVPSAQDLASAGGGDDDRARYAGEVRQADRLLSPVLERGVRSGSVILVTSDHGEVLDEERCGVQHERSASDHVLRVPMVLAGPGLSAAVDDRRVGLTDVMPTLLHEAGLPDPRPDLRTVERGVWVGESGLCDPECASQCDPVGVMGKDRVVIGPSSRYTERPGRPPFGDAALAPHLDAYGPPALPTGSVQTEQARALGYIEAP